MGHNGIHSSQFYVFKGLKSETHYGVKSELVLRNRRYDCLQIRREGKVI